MRTSFGEFVLDEGAREVRRAGSPVHLTPKAYALLTYLACRPRRAVAKSELLEHLWPGVFVTESALTTVVKELRHALGDSAEEPRYVRSVRGFGYAFEAEPLVLDAPVGSVAGEASPPTAALHEFRVVWKDREVGLADGPNLLGRTHEAAVWVDDTSVSRRHAVIHVDGDCATIEDCGSKNGTFVAERRIDGETALRPGEVFQLGEVRLALYRYEAAKTTTTGA